MKLSPKASEFVFQMFAQAAGGVLAAAVVVLFGAALGAISDVPLDVLVRPAPQWSAQW